MDATGKIDGVEPDEVEIWFVWNDGSHGGTIQPEYPTYYIGTGKKGHMYKFYVAVDSPFLPELKAVAGLIGEDERSVGRKAHLPIPWSKRFKVPKEWVDSCLLWADH